MIEFMVHSQVLPENTEDKLHLFHMLFNYADNCRHYIASVTDECMSTGHWCHDRRKLKYLEKNLSQFHLIHKPHMHWLGPEARPSL